MIEIVDRPVYKAETAKRCFLTLKAAINAEAAAIIKQKYPTQKADWDYYHGMAACLDRGFFWKEEPRLVRLHDRLVRIITKKFKGQSK